MSRKRKNNIDEIVSQAESEGLSYGQYAARERPVIVKRHIPDIDKPRGMSTIQAALRVDCPRLCEEAIHSGQPAPMPPVRTQVKNMLCTVTEPNKREYVGRKGLPSEMVVRIRALRAQGLTHRSIALECGISLSSVKRYLREEQS